MRYRLMVSQKKLLEGAVFFVVLVVELSNLFLKNSWLYYPSELYKFDLIRMTSVFGNLQKGFSVNLDGVNLGGF